MLGWIRRVFQKFASQPGDSVEHQEGQERETRLQKVLFWSPYATMAPEPYPPPTLLEHSADPPFLSWPLFLCRSACLLLLLCCCSFHTTPGACLTFLLSFFALGFPLLQWFSPSPSACLSPWFPNPWSNEVYPEQLLTVTPMSFCGPRLRFRAFAPSSHSTYDLPHVAFMTFLTLHLRPSALFGAACAEVNA